MTLIRADYPDIKFIKKTGKSVSSSFEIPACRQSGVSSIELEVVFQISRNLLLTDLN